MVVLNKIDVPDARELAELVRPEFEARGLRVFKVSAATHEGLRELTFAMGEWVAAARADAAVEEPTRLVIRPKQLGEAGVPGAPGRTTSMFLVTGEKPERWIRQTDFTNDEAVGYLADRLARLGVEEELRQGRRHRRRRGRDRRRWTTAYVFDWQPHASRRCVQTAPRGPRGTDQRLAWRRAGSRARVTLTGRRSYGADGADRSGPARSSSRSDRPR